MAQGGHMKKLFIYYSNTGNGDAVSGFFESKGYDIRKVIPKKELPKSFFFKIMTGGFLAGLHVKSKLKDFDPDVSAYDEIVIGSPIWNGLPASPINTVLRDVDLTQKKVYFVLYSGSGSAPKAVQLLKDKYNAEVVELREPKQDPEFGKKLAAKFAD